MFNTVEIVEMLLDADKATSISPDLGDCVMALSEFNIRRSSHGTPVDMSVSQ